MADRKVINFTPTAEQSVRLVGSNAKGNSKNLTAPIGYIAADDALYRDLIQWPIDWPADMWRIMDAWVEFQPASYDLGHQHGVGFGGSPRIKVRTAPGPWTSDGGSPDHWADTAHSNSDWALSSTAIDPTADSGVMGNPDALQRVNVRSYIERIAPVRVNRKNGGPCAGAVDHGVVVLAYGEGSGTNRWGYTTIRSSNPHNGPVLVIAYDSTVPPGVPRIDSPVPGGNPTVVGSPSGRTLTVDLTANLFAGDTATRVQLDVHADASTADEDPELAQPVTGARIATTGAVTPTPRGPLNAYTVTLTGLPARTAAMYRVRVQNQKGAWGRWTVLSEGRIQTAYTPGMPIDARMTTDQQRPRVSATLNSADPLDGVTGLTGIFVKYNSDGTTTNLWPNLDKVGIGYVAGVKRAEVDWGGVGLNDGDRVSFRLAVYNRDGILSPLSPERTVTMRTAVGPTFDPPDATTKLKNRRGPITITDTIEFDAFRYRLYRNDVLFYTSPVIASGPDVTADITIPAGMLNWGDTFGIEAETRPTNTTVFGPTSPRAYLYVNSLPTTILTARAGVR